MYETILHMHVMTSRGSKERNVIYRVKNFDDMVKVSIQHNLMISSHQNQTIHIHQVSRYQRVHQQK